MEQTKTKATDEVAVLTGRGVDVELFGRTYHVTPLPLGKDLEWRTKFSELYGDLFAGIDFEDPQAASARLIPAMVSRGVDGFVDLMFLYSPVLRADRQRILQSVKTSDDLDELLDAAIKVFEVAAPIVKKIIQRTESILTAMGRALGAEQTTSSSV